MADDARSRLFRQIVQRTDEHMLLERMKLHGFWPEHLPLPPDPPDEAAEKKALEAEMAELRSQQAAVANPEQALAEERKRRWEESKQRRAAAKAEREEQARQRREAYQAYRQQTIVHAGVGVSSGLQDTNSDVARLQQRDLPVMLRSQDLAQRMGVPLSTLRWLTYHRRGATLVHYHRYTIPKKTGGRRAISAPKPALRRAQRWILQNILQRLPCAAEAHGFVGRRSIVSNAAPHAGQPVVVNLDLQDFFPSLTFQRVKGLFRKLGYSEHVATTLSLLCTEPPRVQAQLNGKTYYVALSERVLPQGACTSPAITNAVCLRMDRRLAGLARRHGFRYTRYADDLTFSGTNGRAVGRLLRSIRAVIEDEGFREHPDKTRVMRRGGQQKVTGVVVNHRPTVSRSEVRRLRAILHNARRHGLESQNRDSHPRFADYLRGRVAFVCMVDPRRGAPLREALRRLLAE